MILLIIFLVLLVKGIIDKTTWMIVIGIIGLLLI